MITLLVLDVDGCLNDGKITYTSDGQELKSFNVKDGLGIVSWIKMGKKVAIITGRQSDITEKRAKELHVNYIYQNIKNKRKALEEILEKESLSFDNVAVIGDDLNDLPMFKVIKNSFTPRDGMLSKYANCVLNKKGGDGAVREMIDILIKSENLQEEFMKAWS